MPTAPKMMLTNVTVEANSPSHLYRTANTGPRTAEGMAAMRTRTWAFQAAEVEQDGLSIRKERLQSHI